MQKLIAFTILIASAFLYLAYQPYAVLADRAELAVQVGAESVDRAYCEYGTGRSLTAMLSPDRAKAAWLWAACDVVQAQARAADLKYNVRL